MKWVYDLKFKTEGGIEMIDRFKARLVGCGYAQREGEDYQKTFASTIRAVTVRLFFAEVAHRDLELILIDVVKAFTHAEMEDRLFIRLPRGFERDGKIGLLNQALEGTKQAANLWQNLLSECLMHCGFKRSAIDPNLYTMSSNSTYIIIVVWVDDLAVGYNDKPMLDTIISKLAKRIKLKVAELNTFIGVDITRDRKRRTITLSQSRYISSLANKHLSESSLKSWKHMTPSATSREETTKFMKIGEAQTEAELRSMINKGYLTILGALMWAAVMTMPDIMFHVSHLARFMQSPSTEAYEAVVNVLKYAFTRRDIGLTYGGEYVPPPFNLTQTGVPEVWSDASFGGSLVIPYGGGFIRWRNAAVVWIARKFKFVPLSTCEAEVAALIIMVKEVLFVVQVLSDMDVVFPTNTPLPCITDSQSGQQTIENPGVTKHTAHFERWLHWGRELRMKKGIIVILVSTKIMMADDKSKVVDRQKFLDCRRFQLNLD